MSGLHKGFEHSFPVTADWLWEALRVALPLVTTHASWYEATRRVEWSTETEALAWGQQMWVSVEPSGEGAVLRYSGQSVMYGSLGDHHRRAKTFETLVASVDEQRTHPSSLPSRWAPLPDQVRWWDGLTWRDDPPAPPAGWQPDPSSRHQLRYWDGTRWTAEVSDNGITAQDDLASGG